MFLSYILITRKVWPQVKFAEMACNCFVCDAYINTMVVQSTIVLVDLAIIKKFYPVFVLWSVTTLPRCTKCCKMYGKVTSSDLYAHIPIP